MKFSPYILQLLAQKSGRDLRHSADCEFLAFDIESVTGDHIGVNTLKRLLGFIDDEREPRVTTLDIIANYLGFEYWESLRVYDDKSNSSFESETDEIRVAELTVGCVVQISYLPDRRIEMKFLGDNCFRILASENSKLLAGDEISLTHIVQGYPLLVSEVVRDGQSLGSFTAGKAQGITFKLL